MSLVLLLATSSVEAPSRETLFGLDAPQAAAVGAATAGAGALALAFAGAGLTTLSPAFVILPIIATVGLPIATAVGAVAGAALDESAMSVGVATGAGVLGGGMVGGALALGIASLAGSNEQAGLVIAWSGGMLGGTIGAAAMAALTTSWSE